MFDDELDNLTWAFCHAKGPDPMIAIGNTPLPNLSDLRIVAQLKPSSNAGCVNVINQDGTVMSVQEDGTVQTRPSGSDGSFEQGAVNGNFVVFSPFGKAAYAFPLFQQIPA